MYLSFAVILAVISFYAGAHFGANSTQTSSTQSASPAADGYRMNGNRQRGAAGAGMTTGKILSVNPQSIVVALRDGGSKIIFISPTTEISKFTAGTPFDLVENGNVSIIGDANPDGSLNARMIQIRPDVPLRQNASTSSSPQPTANQ